MSILNPKPLTAAAAAAQASNPATPLGAALSATIASQVFPLAPGIPKPTTPGTVPVLRTVGDGLASYWEAIHNGGPGYIYHWMNGAASGGGYIVGIGNDGGTGGGIIIRNKAGGIGQKIEQLATITSATAYGLAVEQKSALAPAVSMVQRNEGTANLLELFSYVTTDIGAKMQVWNAYTGTAGSVDGYSGEFRWSKKMQVRGDLGVDARSPSTKTDEWAKHTILNHNGLQFENPSAAGSWWAWRIQAQEGAEANRLNFQTAATSTTPGAAAYSTMISLRHNQLGFYGATPVSKPAALPVDAADLATAIALVNYLKNSVVKPLGLAA